MTKFRTNKKTGKAFPVGGKKSSKLHGSAKPRGKLVKSYIDLDGVGHLTAKGSLVTQSILFPKDKFTKIQAKNYLKEHGKVHNKVDVKPNTLRYRQVQPHNFNKSTFVTKKLSNGIILVQAKIK